LQRNRSARGYKKESQDNLINYFWRAVAGSHSLIRPLHFASVDRFLMKPLTEMSVRSLPSERKRLSCCYKSFDYPCYAPKRYFDDS